MVTIRVLFDGNIEKGRELAQLFVRNAPDIELLFLPEVTDFGGIRYLVSFSSPPELIAKLPDLQVIFSTGAGVDQLNVSSLPEHISVTRMMDASITSGVVEYVVLGTLALHRDLPHYISAQTRGKWEPLPSVLAADRSVGIMGVGTIGQVVAARLAGFGFPVVGWSRSAKQIEGVRCYSGSDGLSEFLGKSDILICLLPLTGETEGILSASLFKQLPRGAMLLNSGRGAHLVAEDLLTALDTGQLSAAMLDVGSPEPLPADHPFWAHPQILQTPHIAGRTRPESLFRQITENVRAHQEGRPMFGSVARDLGY